MATPDIYTIKGNDPKRPSEKLQLGDILRRCEEIARENKDGKRYFVGRECIRGRLRLGVRTWDGLTAKVKSRSEKVKDHRWRGGKAGRAVSHAPSRHPDDSVYEPEGYVGPDEEVEVY